MPIASRRVFAVALESTRGTFNTGMTAANDAVPSIREAKANSTPVRVERPTIRLSLTDVPDIYPGVSSVEFNVLAEIGGVPPNDAATTNLASPVWTDLFRACGFEELSHATIATSFGPRIYNVPGGLTGGTAGSPLRHGETVTVTYGTSGGPITGTVVGDFFSEDDLLCINETSGTAGTGTITITGATSGRSTSGTPTRDVTKVVALRLRSDISLMETVSCELYEDGKRMRGRGCMGNVELIMAHGDVLQARFTMRGIQDSYSDVAIPTNANESHYLPPTFLGKDVRLSTIGASPKVYGRDTPSSILNGAINRASINTGNDVQLRENSFETAGFVHAQIVDRSPSGSMNPDEVLNTTFDFIDYLRTGSPLRFKAFLGAVSTGDGNSIDVIAPGCIPTALTDEERENLHTWGLNFDITGGDYDPSAAGEAPGNDNELTIIYR